MVRNHSPCCVRALARASYYRELAPRVPPALRPAPPRALSAGAPAEVLDDGRYLYSERTMYLILPGNGEVRERRDVLRHTNHPRPELLATEPNELWSWDSAKLKGPAKWTCFHLHVVLDVFRRYVVGWMVATKRAPRSRSGSSLRPSVAKGAKSSQLTLHATQPAQSRARRSRCSWPTSA